MMQTPYAVKKRLDTLVSIADQIQRGLDGQPFRWGDTERKAYTPKAAALGITLVTKTGMQKLGRELRLGAKAVGEAYFGAPLSKTVALYVLECQTKPAAVKPKAAKPKEQAK